MARRSEEFSGGIDVIPVQVAGSTGGPPSASAPRSRSSRASSPGFNRFNPNFSPDSSFLYYSETSGCDGTNQTSGEACDSDVHLNINATTWAMLPTAGATPIHLTNAATPSNT